MKTTICILLLLLFSVLLSNAAPTMAINTPAPPYDTLSNITDTIMPSRKAARKARREELKLWQKSDKGKPNLLAQYAPYKFKAKDIVVPTVMVGLGLASITSYWWQENINEGVKQAVHDRLFIGKIGIDDYFQYVPLASPYVLKLCGVRSRHDYLDYSVLLATSYAIMGITVNTIKYSARKLRPDGSSRNSFPSGHTATAFMGAELLRLEFWDTSPWIGVAGYAFAATTGFMRIYHNRHWLTDVLAGAGIGILSAKAAYWLFPAINRYIFPRRYREKIAVAPYATAYSQGLGVQLTF